MVGEVADGLLGLAALRDVAHKAGNADHLSVFESGDRDELADEVFAGFIAHAPLIRGIQYGQISTQDPLKSVGYVGQVFGVDNLREVLADPLVAGPAGERLKSGVE